MQSLIVILNLLFFAMPAPSEALHGASGVVVANESRRVYDDIKARKLLYATYKFNTDFSEIIVDQKGGNDKTFDDFLTELETVDTRGECRFAVCNVKFTTVDDVAREKFIFVLLILDSANVKQKMLYYSNKDILRKELSGISTEFQIARAADLTYSKVVEKLRTH